MKHFSLAGVLMADRFLDFFFPPTAKWQFEGKDEIHAGESRTHTELDYSGIVEVNIAHPTASA